MLCSSRKPTFVLLLLFSGPERFDSNKLKWYNQLQFQSVEYIYTWPCLFASYNAHNNLCKTYAIWMMNSFNRAQSKSVSNSTCLLSVRRNKTKKHGLVLKLRRTKINFCFFQPELASFHWRRRRCGRGIRRGSFVGARVGIGGGSGRQESVWRALQGGRRAGGAPRGVWRLRSEGPEERGGRRGSQIRVVLQGVEISWDLGVRGRGRVVGVLYYHLTTKSGEKLGSQSLKITKRQKIHSLSPGCSVQRAQFSAVKPRTQHTSEKDTQLPTETVFLSTTSAADPRNTKCSDGSQPDPALCDLHNNWLRSVYQLALLKGGARLKNQSLKENTPLNFSARDCTALPDCPVPLGFFNACGVTERVRLEMCKLYFSGTNLNSVLKKIGFSVAEETRCGKKNRLSR
ncbi:putative signal peptide protein [Puccinia sorghi]|uniref:Putative signal peptide protein n=1 Tax=Puccinia sorghi TaxID=27349 RepID=A0A0L6UWC1_9BASI|nr:putative signal peptide protein [Puccinia sorghi]